MTRRAPVIGLLVIALTVQHALAQITTTPITRAQDPRRVEPLGLVVTPSGFLTPVVSVPNGAYLISVINRTGGKDLDLQLDRLTPGVGSGISRVTDDVKVRGRNKFQSLNKLLPGTYRLTVVNFPRWTCTIEVK